MYLQQLLMRNNISVFKTPQLFNINRKYFLLCKQNIHLRMDIGWLWLDSFCSIFLDYQFLRTNKHPSIIINPRSRIQSHSMNSNEYTSGVGSKLESLNFVDVLMLNLRINPLRSKIYFSAYTINFLLLTNMPPSSNTLATKTPLLFISFK